MIVIGCILIFGYSDNIGVTNYSWVVVVACAVAIVFGFILLMCSREGANRLAWRKRLLMIGVLDKVEREKLAGTEMGIRSGKDGAWIEYGNKAALNNYRPAYMALPQNETQGTVIVDPSKNQPPPTKPPVASNYVERKPDYSNNSTISQVPVIEDRSKDPTKLPVNRPPAPNQTTSVIYGNPEPIRYSEMTPSRNPAESGMYPERSMVRLV